MLSVDSDSDTVLASGAQDLPHVIPEQSKLLEILSVDSILDFGKRVARSRVGVEESELKVGGRLLS